MNPLNIPKKHMNYYVLAAVLAIFIVLPINIPVELAKMIDSSLGKVCVVIVAINLFLLHPVLGVIGAIAAYELIRRSSGYTSLYNGLNSQFIPSEKSKTSILNKYNQFPYTVEEYIINKQIPFAFEATDVGLKNASFKPLKSGGENQTKAV